MTTFYSGCLFLVKLFFFFCSISCSLSLCVSLHDTWWQERFNNAIARQTDEEKIVVFSIVRVMPSRKRRKRRRREKKKKNKVSFFNLKRRWKKQCELHHQSVRRFLLECKGLYIYMRASEEWVNEWVSSVVYQSWVCLMYKISLCVYCVYSSDDVHCVRHVYMHTLGCNWI